MAAGATVLSAITWASAGVVALASAGIIASAFFSKKYTEATKYLADVKEYEAKMEAGWVLMEGIASRANELRDLTNQLSQRGKVQLQRLLPLVDDFNKKGVTPELVHAFQAVALTSKALSEMAQVPVIDDSGNLSKDSAIMKGKAQQFLNTEL